MVATCNALVETAIYNIKSALDEIICTPLHFIGNLNMAPSKKWICQLILLHYNLPCKSIKNSDWLKPWMTFFSTKRIWHNNFTVLKRAHSCILTKFYPKTVGSSLSVSTFFPISEFSYFVTRFLNHIFFVINFSYFVIRFYHRAIK